MLKVIAVQQLTLDAKHDNACLHLSLVSATRRAFFSARFFRLFSFYLHSSSAAKLIMIIYANRRHVLACCCRRRCHGYRLRLQVSPTRRRSWRCRRLCRRVPLNENFRPPPTSLVALTSLKIVSCYLASGGRRNIAISMRVCLSVCLSARMSR